MEKKLHKDPLRQREALYSFSSLRLALSVSRIFKEYLLGELHQRHTKQQYRVTIYEARKRSAYKR